MLSLDDRVMATLQMLILYLLDISLKWNLCHQGCFAGSETANVIFSWARVQTRHISGTNVTIVTCTGGTGEKCT